MSSLTNIIFLSPLSVSYFLLALPPYCIFYDLPLTLYWSPRPYTGKHLGQDRSDFVLLAHPHLGCSVTYCEYLFGSCYDVVHLSIPNPSPIPEWVCAKPWPHVQVRIGRIAGQYAKPRSSSTEKIGDREVLSFRSVVYDHHPVLSSWHSNAHSGETMSMGMKASYSLPKGVVLIYILSALT